MAAAKKPIAKSKSNITGADITGQKYNTQIKEEAAKVRLKVRMKEKLTPYEKSVLGADAAIKKLNTPSKENNMSTAKKPAAKKAPASSYAKKNAALEAELKRQTQGKKPARGYTYGKNVGP